MPTVGRFTSRGDMLLPDNGGIIEGYTNAISFDGVDDSILVANNALLNPTTAISVEFWMYVRSFPPQTTPLNEANIIDKNHYAQYRFGVATHQTAGFGYFHSTVAVTDGTTVKYVDDYTGNGTLLKPELNKWYHIAYTFDIATLTATLYVNGEYFTSGVYTSLAGSTQIVTSGNGLYIGRQKPSSTVFFDGIVRDIRMWNVVRTANQIKTFMNEPVYGQPGLIAWWPMDDTYSTTLTDMSGNNLSGTFNGGPTRVSTVNGPFTVDGGFNKVRLDGSTGAVTLPNLTVTNAVTVEVWACPSKFSGGKIMGKHTGTTDCQGTIGIESNGTWVFEITLNGVYTKVSGLVLELDVWVHLAGVYDGSNIYLYQNGTLVASKSASGTISGNNIGWAIGKINAESVNGPYQGLVRQVALWKVGRTASQIKEDMNNLVPQQGMLGLWNFSEQSGSVVYDTSGNNNHGTVVGGLTRILNPAIFGVSSEFIEGKNFTDSSINLSFSADNKLSIRGELKEAATTAIQLYQTSNPTKGYANTNFNPVGTLITDKVTFELKCMFSDLNAVSQSIICNFEGGGIGFECSPSNRPYFQIHNGSYILAQAIDPITDPTKWVHLAGTYDGANVKLYIDGVLQNTTPATGNVKSSGQPIMIGVNPPDNSAYFNGGFSEIRLWNIARTQAEIQSTMNSELGGNETGLIGYWKCCESYEGYLYDSSPSGKHAQLFGEYRRLFV